MADSDSYVVRCGKSVRADEVFHAWTSGILPRMLKTLPLKTNPIDRHFLLMGIVELTYKNRTDPGQAETCATVAKMHVAEFPTIAPFLKEEFNGTLPRVTTFQHYATLLAERGQYDDAVAVCESAIKHGLSDGTKGGYASRIERIQKKAKSP